MWFLLYRVSPRKLGYNVVASLAISLIGLGGLELSESDHDPQRVCPRHQLPLYVITRSHSLQRLAVTSSGLSYGVSDAGLPSEKVVASSSRPVIRVKVNSSSGNWVA
ncbi:hypothetical protein Tco_0670986 [Tanacetum coccineum]